MFRFTHQGATIGALLKFLRIQRFDIIECITWIIKHFISLMHGYCLITLIYILKATCLSYLTVV